MNYTPLYNLEDEIIAYYVNLSDGGYMVVNANRQNPVVIEFGYLSIPLTSASETEYSSNEILTNQNDKTYYWGAGLFEKEKNVLSHTGLSNGLETATDDRNQLITSSAALTAILSTCNQAKAANHAYLRSYVLSYPSMMSDVTDADYGFVFGGGLPNSTITASDTIYYSTGANYGTTGEFYGLRSRLTRPSGQPIYVDNHCVATSAFNMLYYYRRVMGQNIATVDREDVFLDIHYYIGNGPVTPDQYGSRFEDYINNETSYNYVYWLEYANTWQNYKNIISNDRMAFIVSWPTITSAHTYNGIGYREYSTGEQYCRIVDGWYESTDRWYLWDTALYAMGYIEIS